MWAVDPKGGMGLAPGSALFARFVYGDTPDDAQPRGYELEFARELADRSSGTSSPGTINGETAAGE